MQYFAELLKYPGLRGNYKSRGGCVLVKRNTHRQRDPSHGHETRTVLPACNSGTEHQSSRFHIEPTDKC